VIEEKRPYFIVGKFLAEKGARNDVFTALEKIQHEKLKLQQCIDILRESNGFYANDKIWTDNHGWDAESDSGKQAREAEILIDKILDDK